MNLGTKLMETQYHYDVEIDGQFAGIIDLMDALGLNEKILIQGAFAAIYGIHHSRVRIYLVNIET